MSSSTKFGFRPRALDVTKKLPIRIRKCRKRSPKVKRTVAVAPSGMEKEEEMESHLQQAILAQKATSAGDSVENHVIPTPKVSTIGNEQYDRIYQGRCSKNKKLITFKDFVPFFLAQSSYNADSDDEEWLSTRRNINVDEFEHIIERLETASQTDIIQPRNARSFLQRFDPGLVDDVYDYWLQKRKRAASRKSKYKVLMPRLCTEARRDEKAVINPYIAFRRRLDKVQTRKKQKTELMTYEKMLQINFAMKRSIALVGALMQREKLKLAAVDFEQAIYQLQYEKHLSNEEVDQIKEAAQHKWATEARTATSVEPITHFMQQAIPDEKCIQRNIELWNSATIVSQTPTAAFPSASEDVAEIEKIGAVDKNSSIDGRYHFKRKHGCRYHAPIPSSLLNSGENLPQSTNSFDDDELYPPFRILPAAKFSHQIDRHLGTECAQGTIQRVGFVRRRIGRGGRYIIDLRTLINSNHSSADRS